MYSVQTFIYKNWMIEMTTQNMCCLVENSFIVWYLEVKCSAAAFKRNEKFTVKRGWFYYPPFKELFLKEAKSNYWLCLD